MNKSDIDKLTEVGIDFNEGKERFLGNENLYIKFLLKFVEDKSFERLKKSISNNDKDLIYSSAHTLKGISGNLSIKSIYEYSVEIMECVDKQDFERSKEILKNLNIKYDEVIESIEELKLIGH